MGRIGLTTHYLSSEEETIAFGELIGSKLFQESPKHKILALSGDLGAGKTTFVKGLAQGLQIQGIVQSPTFTLLHIYEGSIPLYHFDLYRLEHPDEFIRLGFDEYFDSPGICAIEWPERIVLPPHTLSIRFLHNEGKRIATIEGL